MQNNLFEKLQLSSTQIKVFIGTTIAMFVMVSLQYLGVHSPWKASLSWPFFQTTQQNSMYELQKGGV